MSACAPTEYSIMTTGKITRIEITAQNSVQTNRQKTRLVVWGSLPEIRIHYLDLF